MPANQSSYKEIVNNIKTNPYELMPQVLNDLGAYTQLNKHEKDIYCTAVYKALGIYAQHLSHDEPPFSLSKPTPELFIHYNAMDRVLFNIERLLEATYPNTVSERFKKRIARFDNLFVEISNHYFDIAMTVLQSNTLYTTQNKDSIYPVLEIIFKEMKKRKADEDREAYVRQLIQAIADIHTYFKPQMPDVNAELALKKLAELIDKNLPALLKTLSLEIRVKLNKTYQAMLYGLTRFEDINQPSTQSLSSNSIEQSPMPASLLILPQSGSDEVVSSVEDRQPADIDSSTPDESLTLQKQATTERLHELIGIGCSVGCITNIIPWNNETMPTEHGAHYDHDMRTIFELERIILEAVSSKGLNSHINILKALPRLNQYLSTSYEENAKDVVKMIDDLYTALCSQKIKATKPATSQPKHHSNPMSFFARHIEVQTKERNDKRRDKSPKRA